MLAYFIVNDVIKKYTDPIGENQDTDRCLVVNDVIKNTQILLEETKILTADCRKPRY